MYAIFLNQKCFLIWWDFLFGVYAVFLGQKFKKNSDQKVWKKRVCDSQFFENYQINISYFWICINLLKWAQRFQQTAKSKSDGTITPSSWRSYCFKRLFKEMRICRTIKGTLTLNQRYGRKLERIFLKIRVWRRICYRTWILLCV